MKLELKTNELLLRTFDVSESEVLYKMIDENREHLGKWFSWVEKTTKIKDMEKFIMEENEKFSKNRGVYLA